MNAPHNGQARMLPHSIEAEEYLLSSCMLDGQEVIARCHEAGIVAGSFYDSKHGIIYDALCYLLSEHQPTEPANVAEELKETGQLDAIGGYAFLTQVSSRIPTTAQAGYFIEKVREQSLLREIIRSATGAVEDCYNFSGGIEEFSNRIKRSMDGVLKNGSDGFRSTLEEWKDRRAGVGRVLLDEQPTLFLRDVAIFNRGNLGMLTAASKSGKTAACGAILGAIIAGPDQRGDTLGFWAHNETGHAVLHLDTEQSPEDHEALLETAKRRARAAQVPPWLYSFGVKGISPDELRRKIRLLLRETNRIHKGVFLVLLDGAADFVQDPNDPKEANQFVTELESLSTEFNCSVVAVVHLNPAPKNQPSKSRGHLGSQLERKCETDLRLVKDGDDITTMFTSSYRHAPIMEKDGPRFSWDRKEEMHLSLAGTNQQAHDDDERDALRELATDSYAETPSRRMRYSALVSAIEKTANCKERKAQEKVKRMKKLGVIREVPPRLLEIVS
jgi:replicative DNA helicase